MRLGRRGRAGALVTTAPARSGGSTRRACCRQRTDRSLALAGSSVFSTIATELQHLSKAIANANRTIMRSRDAIRTPCRSSCARTRRSARRGRLYRRGARPHRRGRRVASCASVGATLAERPRSRRIVAESHGALSSCSSGDVCAQSLLQLDGWSPSCPGRPPGPRRQRDRTGGPRDGRQRRRRGRPRHGRRGDAVLAQDNHRFFPKLRWRGRARR